MDINVITLEDGKDYLIIDTVEIGDNKYFVLSSNDDEDNVVIRKIIFNNGEEYIDKLDSDDEYEDVMKCFYDKNRKD